VRSDVPGIPGTGDFLEELYWVGVGNVSLVKQRVCRCLGPPREGGRETRESQWIFRRGRRCRYILKENERENLWIDLNDKMVWSMGCFSHTLVKREPGFRELASAVVTPRGSEARKGRTTIRRAPGQIEKL